MPSLPQELLNSLSLLPHFDEKAFVEAHSEENKITSIRLNPFKKTELDFDLNTPVSWNSEGFYLDSRPSFTLDPLFQAGCYYVQEAGSMFLEFALKQTVDFSKTLKILDLCAAPGGKSTLINSLMNEESLLVANEFIKSRADVLVQNLSKWGTCNTIVTNNDPQKFSELSSFFDVIVIDAPCSGSGLFRKQPEAIDEWSENNVNVCSIRQQKILADIMPSLADNGILFYSTCSYSLKEDEEIVEWLIQQYNLEYVALSPDKDWGIVETRFGYRFYPHLTKSEGFFCAVLRKRSHNPSHNPFKKKNYIEASKAESALLESFIHKTESQSIVKKNNQFHLVNKLVEKFLIAFEKQFYFKKAGMVIGEIKGKDIVPNHELAWSTALHKNINILSLDKERVLKYLRKESFSITDNSVGLVLICYKNQGIGWAKLLQNRINNYLPNELRILK